MNRKRVFQYILILIALGAVVYWRKSSTWDVVNAPPRKGAIIALGDSLTEGVGAADHSADYPTFLYRELEHNVVNRGVAGDTAAMALARLDRDVLSLRPGVVVVLLGGNDILRNIPPDETFKALEEIVTRCIANGAMVTLVGIDRPSVFSGDYNKRFKALAKKTGCIYVPDVLDGILGHPKLMSDQIHPNSDGYKVMAIKIAKAMKPHMKPAG